MGKRVSKKAARLLPRQARKLAKLTNDLGSVQVRLYNCIEEAAESERMLSGYEGNAILCRNEAHARLAAAALVWVEVLENSPVSLANMGRTQGGPGRAGGRNPRPRPVPALRAPGGKRRWTISAPR